MDKETRVIHIWTRVATLQVEIPKLPYEFETAIEDSLGRKLRALANLLVRNGFPEEKWEAAMQQAVKESLWVCSPKAAYKNLVIWELGPKAPEFIIRAIF